MNSKTPVHRFVWNHQYYEKIAKTSKQINNIFGMPPKMLPYVYVHSSLYWWNISEPYFASLTLKKKPGLLTLSHSRGSSLTYQRVSWL